MNDLAAVLFGVNLGLLAVVFSLLQYNRQLKHSSRENHLETRDYIRQQLYLANADNKYNVALKTYIFEKYAVQLSDTDITTMMIEWGKHLESLEEFAEFVKEYLNKKKWLYS